MSVTDVKLRWFSAGNVFAFADATAGTAMHVKLQDASVSILSGAFPTTFGLPI
jgi:hypothetical protein